MAHVIKPMGPAGLRHGVQLRRRTKISREEEYRITANFQMIKYKKEKTNQKVLLQPA